MRYQKFSEKDVSAWHNAWENGMSQKQIAKEYKVAPETIKKYFELYDISVDWNAYHVRLTKEELDQYKKAKKYYLEGDSMLSAREKAGVPASKALGFRNYLKQCGVKIKSLSEVASFVEDHYFFNNIDCELKAYLLGFFAADGHIEKRKDYDSYTLRVGVQINDCHILKLFNKAITNGRSAISVTKKGHTSIAITSKQIGEDLLELGFDSNKTCTWKKLPLLQEDMYPHFIRGFFDGDGSIMLTSRRSGNRLAGFNRKFALVCFNKSILREIEGKIQVPFNYRTIGNKTSMIQGKLAQFKTSWLAESFNLDDLNSIYRYLYSDATYYFLRKKYKFDLAIMNDKECYASLQGNL